MALRGLSVAVCTWVVEAVARVVETVGVAVVETVMVVVAGAGPAVSCSFSPTGWAMLAGSMVVGVTARLTSMAAP